MQAKLRRTFFLPRQNRNPNDCPKSRTPKPPIKKRSVNCCSPYRPNPLIIFIGPIPTPPPASFVSASSDDVHAHTFGGARVCMQSDLGSSSARARKERRTRACRRAGASATREGAQRELGVPAGISGLPYRPSAKHTKRFYSRQARCLALAAACTRRRLRSLHSAEGPIAGVIGACATRASHHRRRRHGVTA